MHAVSRGSDEAVRVLVDAGVDLDARNWDGDTALQLCLRRKEAPELIRLTHDILSDGLLNSIQATRHAIDAKGHFMISVLDAVDLYMEGKVGELNTYVCVQLRTHAGATPFVAFTSCVLNSPDPEWHEVFRFDVESLDPTAVLVAWVIAAPGDSAEEVQQGAEMGLSEEQLRDLKTQEVLTGKKVFRNNPQFGTSLQKSFQRLTRRADRNEDREVHRLRKLALAQSKDCEPTMDLAIPKNLDSSPLEERRWNEVANLRTLLERSGCDIHEPLVPRTHMPLGCVVVRFRQLRTAVWEIEPIEVSRTLRLNCRGNLRIEIDFRPLYFVAKEDKRAKLIPPEEEDAMYGVRALDITTADESNGMLMATDQQSPKGSERHVPTVPPRGRGNSAAMPTGSLSRQIARCIPR